MFRTALRTTAPLVRVTQLRAASTSQPPKGKLRAAWDQVPVDVYPLVFAVSGVCCLGIFTMGWHLATDRHLRLVPDRLRS
ncbi:hypothetical protein CcaverHIS002_0406180 [Cutaneotrichosporon cavernicola]|uniref:Uncharacterized protein n=1 Tax=Cutaneotrichosporon cavernicola TaxID=279322 RepID=A0AA48QVY9_9TREE|nr:uncharacterized protein CcaverHIS019_0406210 [Cutaneotrichosporon cavernicola]BEI84014.1 hypothetical protein CcaverHIS002_0406180 [Cutaneotrichosporon cavernicola]BEI91801.1 hypothetical protein CcaverHIS019_0406210 [Cutaneotrichosporon cavernicola]BEI99572.1 hypothetical protein CcaverHIS631_0406150 [Cutaneotrichosporon cavernicola]BEJ07349.1 hypothetical protein CcaverHIS641_0406180 [Cutaneotrichosporon cavernicola]